MQAGPERWCSRQVRTQPGKEPLFVPAKCTQTFRPPASPMRHRTMENKTIAGQTTPAFSTLRRPVWGSANAAAGQPHCRPSTAPPLPCTPDSPGGSKRALAFSSGIISKRGNCRLPDDPTFHVLEPCYGFLGSPGHKLSPLKGFRNAVRTLTRRVDRSLNGPRNRQQPISRNTHPSSISGTGSLCSGHA